jgi:acetyl esterase/lipase
LLDESLIDWYNACYITDPADVHGPLASPMLTSSHKNLPPAYIATAGFDPLRDDSAQYVRRLQDAGVSVVHRHHPGFLHPFANAIGFGPASRDALLEAASALRTGLAITRMSAFRSGRVAKPAAVAAG